MMVSRALAVASLLLAARPAAAMQQSGPTLVISEVMADPRTASDARGEWFEVHNRGRTALSLRGWSIRSGNDRPQRIAASLVVPGGGYVVLARDGSTKSNGGVRAGYAYGAGISFANGSDWLALSDAHGATVDSVAWRRTTPGASWELGDETRRHPAIDAPHWHLATTRFGAGDRGTPGAPNDGIVVTTDDHEPSPAAPPAVPSAPVVPASRSELIVRVLDVGQGDATYISNGTSKVIIDGGPDTLRFGWLLDSLGLNGSTIDVVILSHEHYDHHAGLRELFRSSRRITVRYFFENGNRYTNAALEHLRDSVSARVARGQTIARDTDDPCGDGRPICTITMNGGAKLHVMRPNPAGTSPNDRSVPVKLVGPDSASFTMWLAGDAEHEEIAWFARAGYDRVPGMKVRVLKGDHHGSCNGVSSWYLRATDPEIVTFSVGRDNGYGHVHSQAKALYSRFGKPWYRTDENGTIVFRTPGTPGGGYRVDVLRGGRSLSGSGDRTSSQGGCNPIP
jgi:beta-lactamase superfamily II metal-dependent hydrolase